MLCHLMISFFNRFKFNEKLIKEAHLLSCIFFFKVI